MDVGRKWNLASVTGPSVTVKLPLETSDAVCSGAVGLALRSPSMVPAFYRLFSEDGSMASISYLGRRGPGFLCRCLN